MQLTLDGTHHTLTPIETFRQTHGLPSDFGVLHFAAGHRPAHPFWHSADLNAVGQKLIGAIPFSVPLDRVTDQPNLLADLFERELVAQAAGSDIERDELENVATTFRNVLEPACYKLFELHYLHKDLAQAKALFDMPAIYQAVLDGSTFIATQEHIYELPEGTRWQVRLIYTMYGATGLLVEQGEEVTLVLDEAAIFPAYAFLEQLCLRAGSSIGQALG